MVFMDMLTRLRVSIFMGRVTRLNLIIFMDMRIGLARLDADMRRERDRKRMVVVLAAGLAKELHALQAACFDLFGGGMRGRFSRVHRRSELGENATEDGGASGVWPVGGSRDSMDGMNKPLCIVI